MNDDIEDLIRGHIPGMADMIQDDIEDLIRRHIAGMADMIQEVYQGEPGNIEEEATASVNTTKRAGGEGAYRGRKGSRNQRRMVLPLFLRGCRLPWTI